MSLVPVMGIVNATPDSFSDGGKYYTPDSDRGFYLLDNFLETCAVRGIRLIDVGGESSRPGSKPVGSHEEIKRILPVIERIKIFDFPFMISVDTYRKETADAAAAHGCDVINDITAGEGSDGEIFDTVIKNRMGIVLMHKQGSPEAMQENPVYDDVVGEVCQYLKTRVRAFLHAGGNKNRVVIDPGIGFGKTMEHNIALLRGIHILKREGYPVLIGASNKRLVGDLTHEDKKRRLGGTVGLHLGAFESGADLVRVHRPDVFFDALHVKEKIFS